MKHCFAPHMNALDDRENSSAEAGTFRDVRPYKGGANSETHI